MSICSSIHLSIIRPSIQLMYNEYILWVEQYQSSVENFELQKLTGELM